ncbi:hypothetical protein [Methanobacterium sp.]|uniref:hypothetical protein n=1 Tax=Methanobacterium sp. TaxID=2164 RepID=UPI0025F0C6F4|nr:hypothetical protein [Methanobacterium sp.]MBI5460403.1 hypothetical protein [Methanobacterium sp.]MDY9922363.1 hypothetical protein [Methanobacterium sp.]
MDEKGFIFTADATLALVVVIVFTVTVASYIMLPMYMGQEHQHLEALADSALQVMEQDGTLDSASVAALSNSSNATNESKMILSSSVDNLIPNGIGYRLTIDPGTPVSVERDSSMNTSYLYNKDTVTRVRVISGPQEGWWGRAWFKSEPVEFTNQQVNLTTTSWIFHNWLTNFYPWSQSGNLRTYSYWGSGTTPQAISFTIPDGATIYGAKYLQGSSSDNRYSWPTTNPAFGTNTVINSKPALVVNSNQFTFLNKRVDSSELMYNYQGNISQSLLNPGLNNFYVNFITNSNYDYNMPWFSILSTYATNITVPVNVSTNKIPFQNAAGLAVDRLTDLGAGNGYGRIYNLETGQVTNLNYLREISWNDMYNHDHSYSDGIPFVITGVNGEDGSAVSVVKDVNIPSDNNILDAYVVVNSWGAVDNTLVEVWDDQSNDWRTVFCSFDIGEAEYSDLSDGYGNLPGTIYIGKELMQGANNKVRITTWDNVPSSDYDLVGLQDSYIMLSTSEYKIKWDTYPFDSHQASDNSEVQTKAFTLTEDSQKAMLFLGLGLNTRNVRVDYGNNQILYQGSVVPFSLDLAALDAQKGFHKITTANSTATNYTLVPGNYPLRITVTGPSKAWESGDYQSLSTGTASIFSGTRIGVINPQIQNEWSTGMGSTAEEAMQNATANLLDKYPGAQNIHTSALFAGNTPNSVTVRLDLWNQ